MRETSLFFFRKNNILFVIIIYREFHLNFYSYIKKYFLA